MSILIVLLLISLAVIGFGIGWFIGNAVVAPKASKYPKGAIGKIPPVPHPPCPPPPLPPPLKIKKPIKR